MSRTVRVAVEGCCHGELHKIYAEINKLPQKSRPELLIICGDFQSLRSPNDFSSLAVPDKYKRLGDFSAYYREKSKAPVLTIFVGGNHEASNFLSEIPYGGWVAPNIYYMGLSSVLWYKGLRIGGISGIYNEHNFYKPRTETAPFDRSSLRSVYHTRFAEFLKMSLIRDKSINCFMSHDWPEGIVHHGDTRRLLKIKPFFKTDIDKGELGSPPARELLKRLMPHYWFSAHLHVKFEATVNHEIDEEASMKRKLSDSASNAVKKPKNDDEIDLDFDKDIPAPAIEQTTPLNNDEIELDIEDHQGTTSSNHEEIELDLDSTDASSKTDEINIDSSKSTSIPTAPQALAKGFSQTNFLALDKVIPGRRFMEFLEIPVTNEHPSANDSDLWYDMEYIKITKWFDKFKRGQGFQRLSMESVTPDLIDQLCKDIDLVKMPADLKLKVPKNFKPNLKNPSLQTEQFKKTFGM